MVSDPPDCNRVEFTKCIIQEAQRGSKIADEGQWVHIDIKRMFNINVLNAHGYHLDDLFGDLKLNAVDENAPSRVRIRLGYFDTFMGEIIHRAVGEMRLAEVAHVSFELDPRMLDESAESLLAAAAAAHNQINSSVVFMDFKFEIKLVEIEETPSRSVYKLDENELYERAIEHKTDANQMFKLGRLRSAFMRYKKSMDYLIIAQQLVTDAIKQNVESSSSLDTTELARFRETLLTAKAHVYSNMALCQLKNKSFDMAIANCTKCLAIDARNVKALFRRGQARTLTKDYDEAIGDFRNALLLEPDNQEAMTSLAYCEKLKKDYEKELASNLKNFFN